MNNSKGETRMPMPRPATMPPTRNLPPPPEIFDPEVLRIVQADYDRKRKITELESERDDWRRQALDAKQEIQRLEMRLVREQQEADATLRKEREDHDGVVGRLMQERDVLKAEVTRVITCAQAGASVFLQILDDGKRPVTTAADRAGLAAVAEELMREEFPHVVTAGPRDYPSKDELTGGTS
jgi:hypothetical protein